MTSRLYNPTLHYPIVSSWWLAHSWPVIPEDHLSTTGIIIYDIDNTPVLAGWVYKTDSSFGLIEFTIVNPNIKGLQRDLAFDVYMESVVKYSKDLGIKTLFTSLSNQSLLKRFIKAGATISDNGVTNLIWRL